MKELRVIKIIVAILIVTLSSGLCVSCDDINQNEDIDKTY